MTEPIREAHDITSRSDWLQMRRADLTASAIGALFDLHPYLSRQQLADRMRGISDAGSSTPPDNAAMRRGRILESAVASAVAEDRPEWVVEKATQYFRLADHRLGATPDYFVADPVIGRGVLEIKTATPQKWEEWHGQPPLAYVLQVVVQMMCTGCEWGVIATMLTSHSFPVHYTPVRRHAKAEERILSAAAGWWRDFETGAPGAPSDPAGLAELFDDGSVIDLSADNELPALLDEREMLKASVSADEKRLGEIDYQIKNRIGKARTARLPGWQLTFATSHRKETIIPAKDIRTLRIKRLREEDAAYAG